MEMSRAGSPLAKCYQSIRMYRLSRMTDQFMTFARCLGAANTTAARFYGPGQLDGRLRKGSAMNLVEASDLSSEQFAKMQDQAKRAESNAQLQRADVTRALPLTNTA